MRNHGLMSVLCVAWLCLVGTGLAQSEDPAGEMQARFEPRKPTVVLTYRVSYYLFSIQLKQLATATAYVTEGVWHGVSGTDTVACLVDFRMDTPPSAKKSGKSRVSLHNRITTVLTIPGLEAIRYAKRSDEEFHVLLKNLVVRNLETYDLESGDLRYYRHDFVTGVVNTNLPKASQLATQSKEVSRFLKTLFAFYAGQPPPGGTGFPIRVYVYTEGAMVPFTLSTDHKRRTVDVLGKSIPTVCLRAEPARDAKGRGREFRTYAASFEDVSLHTRADDLITLARQSLSWSMVPLVTRFGLFIGTVQGVLIDIRALPLGPKKAEPAVVPVDPTVSVEEPEMDS